MYTYVLYLETGRKVIDAITFLSIMQSLNAERTKVHVLKNGDQEHKVYYYTYNGETIGHAIN